MVRLELIKEDSGAEGQQVTSRVSRMPTEQAARRFYNWMLHRFENYGLIRRMDKIEKLRLFGILRGPRK